MKIFWNFSPIFVNLRHWRRNRKQFQVNFSSFLRRSIDRSNRSFSFDSFGIESNSSGWFRRLLSRSSIESFKTLYRRHTTTDQRMFRISSTWNLFASHIVSKSSLYLSINIEFIEFNNTRFDISEKYRRENSIDGRWRRNFRFAKNFWSIIGSRNGQRNLFTRSLSFKVKRKQFDENFSSFIRSFVRRTPSFYDEIKIHLPAVLDENHHLLFTFYHISCQPKENAPVETPIAYTVRFFRSSNVRHCLFFQWLPLLQNNQLIHGDFALPVAYERPTQNYSLVPPTVRFHFDNEKKLFLFSFRWFRIMTSTTSNGSIITNLYSI